VSTPGDLRPEGTDPPEDAALLRAVAELWALVDPPPDDLAEGALARIAVEDLDFDLLSLVDPGASLAGVRHSAAAEDEGGAWSLEYDGPDFHVYVRLGHVEDHVRVDGWIVPARALTVQLRTEHHRTPLETTADEFGRFEFSQVPSGVTRLGFLAADDQPAARPRITPPFWI
jgi:hypothetical protein